MFLATTAIKSFWDTNKKVVFLGPWCLLSKDKHIWESLDYEIMLSPWRDRDAYYEAGKYTYGTYHYLLDVLTEYLNSIHGTSHSKRFWQIIIGPWLLRFTGAVYDRYYCVKKVFSEYPQLETILLDEGSYVTPMSMEDFSSSYHDDFHSLQYYSQILRQFGVNCPSKKITHANKKTIQHKTWKSLVNKYLFSLTKFIANKRPVVLWDMNLSHRYLIQYIVASKLAVFPVLGEDYYKKYSKVIGDKRINLSFLQSQDEFTRIIVSSLPVNFPTLYLEGFDEFLEESLLQFKNIPKIVMSSNGWLANERIKFLAAHWMNRGTVLCGWQHGGLYGTAKWMPSENHEIEITDKYYTWGWGVPDKASVKSLPNPKISTLKYAKGKSESSEMILFVGTCHPRYLYRFFSCPVGEMFDEYFEWRNVFLRNVKPETRDHMLIRLYPTDHDRDQKNRILEELPNLHFDDYCEDFLTQLEKSRICVVDHPVTSMLESLARNRATILLWNPCYWELRDEAKPIFEELSNVGIWHKNPKLAAEFLNRVSHEPLTWWHDPKTQFARKKFVNQFACGYRNWAKMWWFEMQEHLVSSN